MLFLSFFQFFLFLTMEKNEKKTEGKIEKKNVFFSAVKTPLVREFGKIADNSLNFIFLTSDLD